MCKQIKILVLCFVVCFGYIQPDRATEQKNLVPLIKKTMKLTAKSFYLVSTCVFTSYTTLTILNIKKIYHHLSESQESISDQLYHPNILRFMLCIIIFGWLSPEILTGPIACAMSSFINISDCIKNNKKIKKIEKTLRTTIKVELAKEIATNFLPDNPITCALVLAQPWLFLALICYNMCSH